MLNSEFWNKVERYNSKLIPFCIAILLVIIILEVFVHPEDEQIKLMLKFADIIVISIFIIDLLFLYKRAHEQGHDNKFFIKKYWLDILAVLPFGLMVQGIGRTAIAVTAAEQVTLGQGVVHESIELGKAASKTEKLAKIAREVKVGVRVTRVISKSINLRRFKRNIAKYF